MNDDSYHVLIWIDLSIRTSIRIFKFHTWYESIKKVVLVHLYVVASTFFFLYKPHGIPIWLA